MIKPILSALSFTASLGVLTAGVAIAPASGGTVSSVATQPAAQADAQAGNRRVCRSIRPTGSRLSERMCRTQREWDEAAEAARTGMRRSEHENTVGHNPELNGTNPG